MERRVSFRVTDLRVTDYGRQPDRLRRPFLFDRRGPRKFEDHHSTAGRDAASVSAASVRRKTPTKVYWHPQTGFFRSPVGGRRIRMVLSTFNKLLVQVRCESGHVEEVVLSRLDKFTGGSLL